MENEDEIIWREIASVAKGKMWIQRDRFGNDIYLTHERWQHIIDPDNHPEVEPYFDYIRETVHLGCRRQDPYDPHSYKYYRAFPDLPDDNNHIVVCVRFRWITKAGSTVREEKFVTTAYMQSFEE
ncbi:MAG: hypothetical protein HYY20_06925 [Candidatus Tectomicrobia bacterium]|uniref:Uncharacterized protein n=1 Tax=Tectimicrobiota bacterium TaxID=2528274 RepID=A0A932FWQ6_UNCTE|nr:hypothetical protein [Candidatus Tectomicrobia bacterium]